jgi:hypothetical protein
MDPPVRALLGKEVRGLIEPLYARFWDRYNELDKSGGGGVLGGRVGVGSSAGKGRVFRMDKAAMSTALVGLGDS